VPFSWFSAALGKPVATSRFASAGQISLNKVPSHKLATHFTVLYSSLFSSFVRLPEKSFSLVKVTLSSCEEIISIKFYVNAENIEENSQFHTE